MSPTKNDAIHLSRYRLILIVLYLITAVILIPLIFVEKSGILVQIELSVRSLSFHFLRGEGGPFFVSLPAKTIQFVHFEKFIIPFTKVEIASESDGNNIIWTEAGTDGTLTIIPNDKYSSIIFEDVVFNELDLQQGTRVELTAPEDNDQIIKIVADKHPIEGRLLIKSTVVIECQYCELDGINDQSKPGVKYVRISNTTSLLSEISFRSDTNLLLVSIEFPEKMELSEKNIYVEDVSFTEERGGNAQTSVVKSGKIIFKDFRDKEIPIEGYEFVKIGKSENLQIARMIFQNEGIELVLVGRVDELKTGTKEELSSRLPSILEWIYNKQPFILYLNTLVLICATIIAILQGLKIAPFDKSKDK